MSEDSVNRKCKLMILPSSFLTNNLELCFILSNRGEKKNMGMGFRVLGLREGLSELYNY
jgi:hypothetical protein